MINFQHQLFFIHIPKTGGTSITVAITNHCTFPNLKSNFKKYKLKHKPASFFKNHIITKNYWNSFFKFSIARNPFDRIVSGYLFRPENKLKTIYDFQKFIYNTNPAHYSLSSWLNEDLDYIGRFENFDKTWQEIKELSLLPNNLKLPKKHFCTTNRFKDYKKYYSPLLVNKLRDAWKDDLDKYNYDY